MAAAVGLGEDLAAEWLSKRVEAVRDTRRRPAAVGPERGAFSSLDGAPSDDVRCLPGQAQLRARPLAPLFLKQAPHPPPPGSPPGPPVRWSRCLWRRGGERLQRPCRVEHQLALGARIVT
jgi:hypothetical protein